MDAMHSSDEVQQFGDLRWRRQRRWIVVLSVIAVAAIVALTVWLGGAWLRDVSHRLPSRVQKEWNLVVVNRWNPIPQNYAQPQLTELRGGQSVDSRIVPDLQKMFDAMRADGLNPQVTEGHRTSAEQQSIMDDKIAAYRAKGLSARDAQSEAAKWVAEPGTSEHEIGLAIDVNSTNFNDAESNQAIWAWLAEHAWQYGFIQRYTVDKTDLTGVDAEAWHYRYVGIETAKTIYESGQCLEEYVRAR